jgi:hypothetical protein
MIGMALVRGAESLVLYDKKCDSFPQFGNYLRTILVIQISV